MLALTTLKLISYRTVEVHSGQWMQAQIRLVCSISHVPEKALLNYFTEQLREFHRCDDCYQQSNTYTVH